MQGLFLVLNVADHCTKHSWLRTLVFRNQPKKSPRKKKAKIALKQRIGGRRNSSLKRYREGPVHNVVINKRTKNYEGQVCKGTEDDIEPEPPFNSDNYSDEKHLIVNGIIKEILSRINY